MPNESQYDREERQLDEDMAAGRISPAEHREQLRDLHADYRAGAEEAAQGAYDREMDRW